MREPQIQGAGWGGPPDVSRALQRHHRSMHSTNDKSKRSAGARIALFVGAGVASLLAIAALGVGAFAFWGDDQKDDQGYLTTDSQPFAAGTHALATENLDLDLDGAEG